MNRRTFLISAAAAAASCAAPRSGGSSPFRLAICNETFVGSTFAEACRLARAAGFEGLEIAPFTLSDDPARVHAARRRELRRTMDGEGLRYAGLHWLLRAPKGLHVTTRDAALRARSWDHVRRLIDLSDDLGPDGVLVFGSGKGRSATGGSSRSEALSRFADGLAALAPHARARNTTILIEPLARPFSNILNTVDETAEIVRRVGHPAVRTMIDCRQSAAAGENTPDAIRRHAAVIRHVHVNERDGRHPGTGTFDFAAVFAALRETLFNGWISVEVFKFDAGGERIARESGEYLKRVGGAS